jgi:hypothetical protein
MFGRRIKFVRAGASPSLVQCSRCHEIGHYYTSPKCKWTSSRCFKCGGGHEARDHDFECKKQHKVVGVCDCVLKCLLCKNSGHHAREKGCPARGDFVPPCLPRAAPAEAMPAVEDAFKNDAIPFTRPSARPAYKGKGGNRRKGRSSRGPPRILVVPEMIDDICAKDDDALRAYCFCCPALRIDEFQALYYVPPESDITPGLSARGKSAQDIFQGMHSPQEQGTDVLLPRLALTSSTRKRNCADSSPGLQGTRYSSHKLRSDRTSGTDGVAGQHAIG